MGEADNELRSLMQSVDTESGAMSSAVSDDGGSGGVAFRRKSPAEVSSVLKRADKLYEKGTTVLDFIRGKAKRKNP